VPQSLRPYLLGVPNVGVSYFFIPELTVVRVSAIAVKTDTRLGPTGRPLRVKRAAKVSREIGLPGT